MAFSFQPKTAGMDGLVLCLDAANTKSYPGSGTTWTDLSQTAITGSLTNGPTFSSVNGGGIIFDGTNDYVEVGNNLNSYVDVSRSLSIEAVVNVISSSNNNVIIANAWDTAGINVRKLTTNAIRFIYINDGVNFRGWDSNVLSSGICHITTTFNGSNANNTGSYNLYVNGVLNNSSSLQIGTITSVQPSRPLSIGSALDSLNGRQGYYSGSIHSVKIYNRALSATEVLQNYNAICGRFGKTPTITDGDALSFVNAANISNETQQSAINTLVTDLKGAGLWSKMKAIYPFVGGTATTHKWNLKDPRDVNAAFRLTFSGGWTHSSTGAKANGSNGYADTYLIPNSILSLNNNHISHYAVTGFSIGSGMVMGTSNNTINQGLYIYGPFGAGNVEDYSRNNTSTTTVTSITNGGTTGLFINNRTSSTSFTIRRNNGSSSTKTNNSNGMSLYSIWLNATNNTAGGNVPYYTDSEFGFATIGDGLTDADASNLYTIVQKYQTTLGRQV